MIINRVAGGEAPELIAYTESKGLKVTGIVPQDQQIFEYDLKGKAVFDLPEDSAAVSAVFGILDGLKIP